ncbi:DUF397 domain-containing protein [Streptomyces sp. NPDC060131]|uniref:DUF397 domain-containing protein n=1 Tax=Streptomyces sp. NPDC060131 TaxID=3347058 RepID=UPI00364B4693
MSIMDNWRRSSYSGPGDGNECVEIATSATRVAVRDSKAPARAILAFPVQPVCGRPLLRWEHRAISRILAQSTPGAY